MKLDRKALVIQHMDHDTPGRFLEFFAADGFYPVYLRLFEGAAFPDPSGFDLMLVQGGAQNVWQEAEVPWLAEEKAMIREWVSAGRPYFGLCLGHQLLCDALGGAVGPAQLGEVGVFDVALTAAGLAHPLMAGQGPRHRVMQWHHAEVKRAPQNAVVLAEGERTKIQAVAVGRHAVSTQFHCELTAQSMGSWASLPKWIAALTEEHGPSAYEDFVRTAFPLMPEMERFTRGLWRNLLRESGLKT
jgi:GMP synthase-like glutamine amidotransferase